MPLLRIFFFFNDTATTEIYTLSLHDALPICLLIDQHGIDDAAHLDELLPVTAVAGETRDFPRRDRTDLAQADLGHHSIKAGARDTACRRAPKIVIDRFDARPAQHRQTITHRILQGAALAIVENLMGGGLPYIQDRLAL